MFRFVLTVLCTGIFLTATAADMDTKPAEAALARMFPGADLQALKLRPSPVSGVFEAQMDTHVFYVTSDGKHVFAGDLIDTSKRINLSDERRQTMTAEILNGLSEDGMVVLPTKTVRRTITVFTDVDCGYCRRLHVQDVPELLKHGVKVRYLLYPRQGPGTDTYKRSVAVWCADDRVKAVGDAKTGKQIEMKTCPNPVSENVALGKRLGVNGTPAIFLDDGSRTRGYVPAQQMLAILGLDGDSESAKK